LAWLLYLYYDITRLARKAFPVTCPTPVLGLTSELPGWFSFPALALPGSAPSCVPDGARSAVPLSSMPVLEGIFLYNAILLSLLLFLPLPGAAVKEVTKEFGMSRMKLMMSYYSKRGFLDFASN